ncbi:MAG: sarcosine oxidase subunit alpha family protein [Rhodobacteraceae bacterium]|jgi:sarcosine oxidase subunit alpha|nr:sarcosine oxidase subunit alpha family protein [Paracoccaceae bacterium]
MSGRLATGGRLIDRSQRVAFTFDGARLSGFAGDTLAAALLGAGQVLVGRSFKYHRPRGIVAYGPEEPNGLVGLGQAGRFEPNARATQVELHDGLMAESQNRWPSLAFDVGAVNGLAARVLPAGFYYKTFIHPRPFWKHLFEPVIRRAAGLGRAPRHRDDDTYEQVHAHVDVLVVGGGVAGLSAALAAGRAGARVMLVEQAAHWGGRAPVDGDPVGGQAPDHWVKDAVEALEDMANVRLVARCAAVGVYDHGFVLAAERLTEHDPGAPGPRQRLWRIRAGRVVLAAGAIERPLAFPGNDLPGVMLASGVRDYLVNHAVFPGDRTVVVTNNDDAYRTALALVAAGLRVPAILDARAAPAGALADAARAAGIRVLAGHGIAGVAGRQRVTGVQVCAVAGTGAVIEEIACEAVAMSGGWSPAVHLWSHCGGRVAWDADRAMFRPDPAHPPRGADGTAMVIPAGAANGRLSPAAALAEGMAAGAAAAAGRDRGVDADDPAGTDIAPVWMMPTGAGVALRSKAFLDFQNDVKVADVDLAAREGFESVEHTKRYTTLGMATDQGKLSNINGLAVLAQALHQEIPAVGTTTFRPPFTPVTLGTLAGEARGDLFQPVRATPMLDWHQAQGAVLEPVGLWRRPYCYPAAGETHAAAVAREVYAVRQGVGMLDASTLGKILVQGPDAGRFLDMLYTGAMSLLPVGRCRYGLMCSEQGFLIDDGVVARLSDDAWLCHTTTGGADRIHAHMEDWLQTEWFDWRVFTLNLTEQFAQVAVAGPRARDVLETLSGDIDLTAAALPLMHWTQGTLAGIPARVFRISFSGELGFEVAVPAARGMDLWQALLRAGQGFGITPYGTEALHVLRAEKGFIMIGDETDGTVTPRDLGLGGMISGKKADFLGKRGMERTHLAAPDRWRLVGLRAADDSVLPDGAYVLDAGTTENGQRATQGRVTSTYHSPTLKRGVALALLRHGPDRMGQSVEVSRIGALPLRATVVAPCQYDPDGGRMHG